VVTMFGMNEFSDTSSWGKMQSRKTDHNAEGAQGKFPLQNMQQNKRTFTVGPVDDVSFAFHLCDHEEDRLSAKIMVKLSELTKIKGQLTAYCTLNARLDRFVYESMARSADPKNVCADTNKAHSEIVKAMNVPKSKCTRVSDLSNPENRESLIEALMSVDNAFVIPFRERLVQSTTGGEASRTWKIETSTSVLPFGSKGKEKVRADAAQQARSRQCWDAVCKARTYELKRKIQWDLKRTIDPKTVELREVDKFVDAWRCYAIEEGALPPNSDSVKLLDTNGTPLRITTLEHVTRNPNFFEYAAMCICSRWQNAIMIVTAKPNAKDACYFNTVSAQMVTPPNFMRSLQDPSRAAPKLKLPFANLFEMMRDFVSDRSDRDANSNAEAMVDMDMDYGAPVTNAPVTIMVDVENPETKKRKIEETEDNEYEYM